MTKNDILKEISKKKLQISEIQKEIETLEQQELNIPHLISEPWKSCPAENAIAWTSIVEKQDYLVINCDDGVVFFPNFNQNIIDFRDLYEDYMTNMDDYTEIWKHLYNKYDIFINSIMVVPKSKGIYLFKYEKNDSYSIHPMKINSDYELVDQD